jgi:hypothetical protein
VGLEAAAAFTWDISAEVMDTEESREVINGADDFCDVAASAGAGGVAT